MINNYINIFSLYKFFIVFIVLFNISQAKYIYADKKLYKNDDLNILLALDYERNNDYNNSIDIFIQLFEKSNRYIYIKRSLEILLKLNDDEAIVFFIEKYMKYIIQKEGYQKIMGIYIYSLLNINNFIAYFNALLYFLF